MRILFRLLSLVTLISLPTQLWAAAPDEPPCHHGAGVLTHCTQQNLSDYLAAFFSDSLPYVLTICIVMVTASGVQYMLSGFSPDGNKKAKQRILGILGGLIFYFFITYLVSLIGNQIIVTPNQ